MATALIVPVADLTLNVLNGVLSAIQGVDRKIAIGLSNDTKYVWNRPLVYFNSGTADEGLPGSIDAEYALAFGARKTSGPVATGSVGVMTYYVSNLNVTVALMWSVPFDYNLYSNWWNVVILNGDQQASAALYESLYNDDSNPFKGDSNFCTRTQQLNGTWVISGCMGASGTPILKVSVELSA